MIFDCCGLSRCVTGGRREGGGKRKALTIVTVYRLPIRVTPCNPESESLQGVSSCCPKTHRRAYHVAPDLRWHGQQPYSSPYVSTEYSTSVDDILLHKPLETTSVSLYISTY